MPRRPAPSRHHHGASPQAICFPAARVGDADELRPFRLTIMFYPDGGRIQANPCCAARAIESCEVHRIPAYVPERLISRDGFRNQRLRDQPRDASVPVRKHLRAGLVADVERMEHVRRISRVARECVRAQTVSTALAGRQKCADCLAADPARLHHVSFERDAIEPPRYGIARILRGSGVRVTCRLKLCHFRSRLRRNRSAFHLLSPRISQPQPVRLAELGSEVRAAWSRSQIGRAAQLHLRLATAPFLIFEARCLESNRFIEPCNKAVRIRNGEEC